MVEGALRGHPVTGQAPAERPRPRGRFRALRRDQRGTALVEFALIAPLLFLLLFGIIDFGRALDYYNQVTQLAGQGARAAAVNRNPDGTPDHEWLLASESARNAVHGPAPAEERRGRLHHQLSDERR